jgi:phosphate starvation-inducible protein PhoH and related proteins
MGRRKILTQQVDDVIVQNHRLPNIINKISFRTLNQKRFYAAIGKEDSNIIMAHALAGAGKTYISIQKGLEMLLHKGSPIKKLIIINPTVDVGNEDKLGHLPGDLMEKIKVHNESSIYILNKIIGEAETNKLIERGKIEFMVLNFLRGRNFEDAYIILDEAQNASPLQLKTLITRISDDSKLIIEGDLSQCDKYRANGIPAYQKSGFYDIWKRLAGMKGSYQIEFTAADCIRSGIVKRVLERYELEEEIILGESNPFELNLDAPSEGEFIEGVYIVEN